MNPDPAIVHVTESLSRLGGVESVLLHMLETDKTSVALAILDAPSQHKENIIGLRRNKLCGVRSIRKSAKSLGYYGKPTIYHNFAGVSILQDFIGASPSILFLHTDSPDIFRLLDRRLGSFDGIIASGEDLRKSVSRQIVGHGIPTIGVQYPIPSAFYAGRAREAGSPIKIGYSGRLAREQKQCLRLIEFVEVLAGMEVEFEIEIAGGGECEDELRRRLPGKLTKFLGILSGNDLARSYLSWDFIIVTSDYETGPLVAMEAMASGTIPILPDIPCQAVRLLPASLPKYAVGDMKSAASIVAKIVHSEEIELLSPKMQMLVSERGIATFQGVISDFVSSLGHVNLSRRLPRKAQLSDFIPFAALNNLEDKIR
jgi:glycosyltransferase involved in cell wall biosynthesis